MFPRQTTKQPRIPDMLLKKIQRFGKTTAGFKRVKLILEDGRFIYDVFLAEGGEIIKDGGEMVFGEADLRFKTAEIIDVMEY